MNTDPISDYLTRIRNAQKARKRVVEVPASGVKRKITDILKDNGFINGYELEHTTNKQGKLVIRLKYFNNEGVILGLERVSRPGIRKYVGGDKLPKVLNGLGISIVSTSKGLMTDKDARKQGVGGEILCNIW